jgi:RNA ligase
MFVDMFDIELLDRMRNEGYVRAQTHPTLPYMILNYTEKAAYANVWNDATLRCRGLIVNFVTNEVVARPFDKFFNYSQAGAPSWPLDTLVTVADKLDGSLGILYPAGEGSCEGGCGSSTRWAIATRGSFTSEQAVEGTRMLHEMYPEYEPPAGFTQLFEIIYPENRIVLDYEGERDLVLLGAVHNETGAWTYPHEWPNHDWTGPSATYVGVMTFSDALAVPPRDNAEGLVLYSADTGERLKIKQDDYVALHRVLTGTSARTVWQYMAVNACKDLIKTPKHWGSRLGIDPKRAEQILAVGDDWLGALTQQVPDEFYAWLGDKIRDITLLVDWRRSQVESLYYQLQRNVFGASRAEAWVTLGDRHPEHRGLAFARLDGQDITTQLWRLAYPGVDVPFKKITEDTA